MPRPSLLHRALLRRAPCLFLTTLLYLFTFAAASAVDCSSSHYDESIIVKRIVDGDTLQLTDGRRLRLIGINTPERGKNGPPSEPLAKQAKQKLQQLVSMRIKLRWGKEKQDLHLLLWLK